MGQKGEKRDRAWHEDKTGVSSYQLGDGTTRWRVRLRIHGVRVSESYGSEAEALARRDELTSARRATQTVAEVDVTPRPHGGSVASKDLISFMREEWWPSDVRPRLPRSTRYDYRTTMKRLIHPSPLGRKDPAAVTVEDVVRWQDWAKEEIAKGQPRFSVADIRKAQTVLSACFTWAARRASRNRGQGQSGQRRRLA